MSVPPGTSPSAPFPAATPDGAATAGQSGDDFRRVIAESAGDAEDLNYVVTNVLYARGSLPREVRHAAVKAIRSYQVILSVARDPEGVLAPRETQPQVEP